MKDVSVADANVAARNIFDIFDKKTEDKSKQQERENDLSFENNGVVIRRHQMNSEG